MGVRCVYRSLLLVGWIIHIHILYDYMSLCLQLQHESLFLMMMREVVVEIIGFN